MLSANWRQRGVGRSAKPAVTRQLPCRRAGAKLAMSTQKQWPSSLSPTYNNYQFCLHISQQPVKLTVLDLEPFLL